MAMLAKNNRIVLDWVILLLYIGLVGIGWLMLYANGHKTEAFTLFDFGNPVGRQSIWIGVSFVIMLIVLILDKSFWKKFSAIIYFVSIFLLLFVLIFGTTIKGAKAWISVGPFFNFQPAEFAKFATALALSYYVSMAGFDFRRLNHKFYVAGIMALPMFLILLQPDAGSAFVFVALLAVLYRAGLSGQFFILFFSIALLLILGFLADTMRIGTYLLLLFSLILAYDPKRKWWVGLGFVALVLAVARLLQQGYEQETLLVVGGVFLALIVFKVITKEFRQVVLSLAAMLIGVTIFVSSNYFFNKVLEPHQQDRINVWLRPHLCDPHGSLYNVMQSKMAIGSGGWTGKGFLNGTMTKFNYVPEQNTDFIFCTIGEEQGFIGSTATILLFFLLIYRILSLAERQRQDFSRYYAYSVASILFVHFFINIGMTLGLMPVIGIPLPFISYGGSSLMIFTLMMAVLLKLDS